MSETGPGNDLCEAHRASTIMMVDDEPTTLEVMEMFLQAEGYRNLVKETEPEQVLPRLAELRPDLLLLNLLMPGVSGLDVLCVMQQDQSLREIPVVIITSSTDPKVKRRALELGAADFLSKPVDPSELALRVCNILAARAAPGLPTAALPPVPRALHPNLAGDPERVHTIVSHFVERLYRNLSAMEASFLAESMDELASLAHWLKGSAGTVGLHEFTQPAEALRLLARAAKLDEIEAAIAELRELADRIEIPDALDGMDA